MTPKGIDLAIGSQIRRQRIMHAMSVSDLAYHIGVSEFEIAQYEEGKKRVKASALARACKLFGVEVSYFFDVFDLDWEGGIGAAARY